MSKVLVDRELLELLRNFTFLHDDGCAGALRGNIDKALAAQPAEAEGVERWSELRALAESAPGENWKAGNAYDKKFIPAYQVIADTTDGPCVVLEGNMNFIEQAEAAAAFAAAANPAAVIDLLAALSAVTAERDRLQRNLKFTEQWYAERFERLADLGKSAGCWDAMAAIIANGTADPQEPPTYAQQLVRANHRADVAERERDQLRAEFEGMRKDAVRWRYVRLQGDDTHWLNLLRVDLEDFGGNINAAVDALIDGDTPATAAKEA